MKRLSITNEDGAKLYLTPEGDSAWLEVSNRDGEFISSFKIGKVQALKLAYHLLHDA